LISAKERSLLFIQNISPFLIGLNPTHDSSPRLEEFCDMCKMTSTVQQNFQIIEHLTKETWGRGWVVLVVSTKW